MEPPSVTNSRRVYVFGSGGHARVVAEGARAMGLQVAGFLDGDHSRHGQSVNGIQVLGGLERVAELSREGVFAMGIGANSARQAVCLEIETNGGWIISILHPTAVVAAHTVIERGAYVGPLAVIHVNAQVGRHAIVNTAAIVDHQCVVGDFAHVSANVILGGGTRVGAGALVGVGVSTLPDVSIGPWSDIGAGSVVTRDIGEGVVAYGVPARTMRRKTS